MKAGFQTFLDVAGDAACYALDIIQLAIYETAKNLDPITALEAGIVRGFISYNQYNPDDNDNFFVTDPASYLALLTGQKWTVSHEPAGYVAAPGELVVERWERKVTGSTISHFRLPDWDSLADSKTVRYGALASKRIFRRAK